MAARFGVLLHTWSVGLLVGMNINVQELLCHEDALNFEVREVKAFQLIRKILITAQYSEFVDKTLVLEVIECGGIAVVVRATEEHARRLRESREYAQALC